MTPAGKLQLIAVSVHPVSEEVGVEHREEYVKKDKGEDVTRKGSNGTAIKKIGSPQRHRAVYCPTFAETCFWGLGRWFSG